MLLSIVLVLAPALAPGGAAKAPNVVSIYVGPQVRDGFVDTDRGVRDSVRDLREALGKDKAFRVIDSEEAAELKLYVAGRGKSAGQTITVGAVANGNGSVVGVPTQIFALEAKLRVGVYEQTFRTEKNQATDWHVTWKKCAGEIAKDVSAWLAANRDRIAAKE